MLNKIKLLNINFGPQHPTAQDVLLLLLNLLGIEVVDLAYLDSIEDIHVVYVCEYNAFWGDFISVVRWCIGFVAKLKFISHSSCISIK